MPFCNLIFISSFITAMNVSAPDYWWRHRKSAISWLAKPTFITSESLDNINVIYTVIIIVQLQTPRLPIDVKTSTFYSCINLFDQYPAQNV